MNYFYYNHWVPSGNKRGKGELSLDEVKKRFIDKNLTGNTFYILVGDEKKPTYIINYVSFQLITIHKLNEELETIFEINYKKLKNLDKYKLFLSRISINSYDNNVNQIKNNSISFVKVEYSEVSNTYKIHKFPYYSYTNYEKNIEDSGFFEKELVEEKKLWKDYPKFGDWDWMIEDITMMEKNLKEENI